jgi:hypothetical protein
MQDLVTIFQYTFWIAVFCAVIYTAIDTPLRPVQNWVGSWRDSFIYAFRYYRVALCIAPVYFIFPCLKFFIIRHWGELGTTLLWVAGVWQVIAGGVLAVIALRIHHWAGLEDFDRDHARYEPNRRRELWAAAIGIGVVVVMLTTSIVSLKLVRLIPGPWMPLGSVCHDLLRALAFAALSLIRPCLSLGARRPIHAALIGFSRRRLGFFLWITALTIPVRFAEFATDILVPANAMAAAYLASRLALTAFQIFNFIAFEMTTVRMVQDLALAPEGRFNLGVEETA